MSSPPRSTSAGRALRWHVPRGFERAAGRIFTFVVLGLIFVGVQAAAANTFVVDNDGVQCPAPDFNTISAAVAAAGPGDTIVVCPGLYVEQVQIGVNNLTLLGAQANVDARTRPFIPDPLTQSIIDHPCGPVQIFADNVTINGFTIQGAALTDPCFIAGIWMNPGAQAADTGGAQILYNIVQDNISGIELDSKCNKTALVKFNLIQNNNNPGPGSGNGIQTNFGLCNGTIDRNKFSGHANSSVLVFGPPVTSVASNINVTNNELVGGTPEGVAFLGVSTATISNNVSIGSTSSGTIDLFGGNSGVTVTSNTLFNGQRAIVVDNPFSGFGIPANSNITAHQNCIQGNTVAGMQVDPLAYPLTPQLNAENNWWGHQTGPREIPRNPGGMGDTIIDPDQNVDFVPWLNSCPSGAVAPRQATGGGQITVMGGRGSFGFVAKQDTQTGHLNYTNHVTGAHLNCTVNVVTILSATAADFSGTCTANSTALSFSAHVEDHDKTADVFRITYNAMTEGGTIRSGNINIK